MSEVTFFMIVTPRDVVIADYAVRSYQALEKLDFTLLVYSNYLLPEQKAYYFPRWEKYPFLEIARNPHQDADVEAIKSRVDEESLEGPFEYCDPIWDRELRKIKTDYVASVDADFEIRRPDFVYYMMDALRSTPDLVGYSTDHSPTAVLFEPYGKHTINLNERNHTWFCIYKQEAFRRSQVSHAFHREIHAGAEVERDCWDSSAYFQKSLRDQGLRFENLRGKMRRQFIHYGAFSKNTTVTRRTVRVFRCLALLENWVPRRLAPLVRRTRATVVPWLENNRYEWVRHASIHW